jgi:hypothetical protein
MSTWLKGLLLLIALAVAPAMAEEPAAEVKSLYEHFYAHRRVAIAYLRTGNIDLGTVEIERMRDQWGDDLRRLPPGTMEDHRLAAAVGDTVKAILDSLQAANDGDAERARAQLEKAAAPLNAWRKAHSIRLFSDCIGEIGSAYEQLDVYRTHPPDLRQIALGAVIVAIASLTESALARCDGEAGEKLRTDAEFRRLIDGMSASLRQVPQAVQRRDGAYLHRLLIEQRSFERLLSFRYG